MQQVQKWDYLKLVLQRKAKGFIGLEGYFVWEDGSTQNELERLQQLGLAGWELTSVIPISSGGGLGYAGVTDTITFYFKRLIV